jgi:6-phosphogluconolactonase
MSQNCEVVQPDLFAATVADELVAGIQDCLNEKRSCSVFLAGGKTPAAVYRSLVNPSRFADIDWKNLKLFLGDERWVSHDDSRSNANMVHETLLNKFSLDPGKAPAFYPVDTSLESVEKGAEEFEKLIRSELGVADARSTPQIDILLLGMGTDGHTASLFPGASILFDFQNAPGRVPLCVVAHNLEDGTERISISPRLIVEAKQVFFLVTGEAKAAIVQKALREEVSIQEMPAQIYRSVRGRVVWFLDSPAAKFIS